LPNYFIRFPGLYREDLWAEIGMAKGPDSWDELRTGGAKLKAKGNPVGIGMANHVDSNVSLLSILWSHGAKIVQEDGKTLAIDSKETREALRFGKALYDEAMTSEVLAWDDASNNQLLASKKGSWIHNPISATLSIYNAGDKELYSKIGIGSTPAGPAMRRTPVATNAFGIWKFAKNKDAARAFLNHYVDNWMEGYKVALSYDEPMLKGWVDEGFKFVPTIKEPTKINELKEFTQFGALYGWPGPLTAAAEEWWQTFIIPQMFAKVARGTSIDDAIKDATAALKKIYDKHNT
jgi:multiple sugar transport system substrate-binding protein